MKQFLLFSLCLLTGILSYAQEKQDSIQKQTEFTIISDDKNNEETEDDKNLFFIRSKDYKHPTGNKPKSNQFYSRFEGHLTGAYYGFINFADLPESHSDLKLDFSSSFTVQAYVYRNNINLSARKNFGLVTGLGLEYQNLMFNNDDVSIIKTEDGIATIKPTTEYEGVSNIKRSTLKIIYVTVPLLMEVQFPARYRRSERIYISGGFIGGVRVFSRTKVVYDDKSGSKQNKNNTDNFDLLPIKADATVRVGFGAFCAWGSYSLTNLFCADNVPDLRLYAMGLGITF